MTQNGHIENLPWTILMGHVTVLAEVHTCGNHVLTWLFSMITEIPACQARLPVCQAQYQILFFSSLQFLLTALHTVFTVFPFLGRKPSLRMFKKFSLDPQSQQSAELRFRPRSRRHQKSLTLLTYAQCHLRINRTRHICFFKSSF